MGLMKKNVWVPVLSMGDLQNVFIFLFLCENLNAIHRIHLLTKFQQYSSYSFIKNWLWHPHQNPLRSFKDLIIQSEKGSLFYTMLLLRLKRLLLILYFTQNNPRTQLVYFSLISETELVYHFFPVRVLRLKYSIYNGL